MRYKVEFEFLNDLGEWKKSDVSFDGTMTKDEAEYWCWVFRRREDLRNVRIIEY